MYFVGKDVATALGYQNVRKALADHVAPEDKLQRDGVTIRDPLERDQHPTLINESGLYSLIMGSQLPTAKAFKHWVTAEVLPSIRKTGSYGMSDDPDIEAARLLMKLGDKNGALETLRRAGYPVSVVSRPSQGQGPRSLKGRLDPGLVKLVHQFLDDLLPQIQNWSLLPFVPLHQLFDDWCANHGIQIPGVSQQAFLAVLDEVLPLYGWQMPQQGPDGKYQKVWASGRMDGQEIAVVHLIPCQRAPSYRGIIRL